METLKAIKTRRSVRAFTNKKITHDKLEKIIQAGLLAPSSKNSQPWKFIIIKNKKLILKLGGLLANSKNLNAEPSDPATGKIKKGYYPSIKASGEIIKNSPYLIVVENTCPFSRGRKSVSSSKFSNAINGHDSELISLGCAVQNISLAAHTLGLATVIICDAIAEEKPIKNILKLKGDLIAIIPLGYPAYMLAPRKVNGRAKVTYL